MKIGLVIVGDEILSGKRRDRHQDAVTDMLTARGLELSWIRVLGDDLELLVQSYRETLASDAVVLSTGGIGGTPDDLTRDAVARACGVAIETHPDGEQILHEVFGEDVNPNRLRMIEFPQGAALIPNPVNRIPGFSLRNHYCVPGFPDMAWPMLEWVLDTYYLDQQRPGAWAEHALRVISPESELIRTMEALMGTWPGIKVASLPSTARRGLVELSVRGPVKEVEHAAVWLQERLSNEGIEWSLIDRATGD